MGTTKLRAPRSNGASLIEPSLACAKQLIATNHTAAVQLRGTIAEIPIAQLRHELARPELLREVGATCESSSPLILSGHQPELFHPGVWFKNFLLSHLAQQTQGVAINLVIDNDLCSQTSVRTPTGTTTSLRVATVPYDTCGARVPYEERGINDWEQLESFPRRIAESLAGLVDNPLVHTLWPAVLTAANETGNLGIALSRARHHIEQQWGLRTYELPLSRLCDGDAFRLFAAELLCRCDAFRAAYNQSLTEYRTEHHIRTPAQPVPNLHQHGDWLETPFWVWISSEPTRRPLFAMLSGSSVVLSDQQSHEWRLPRTPQAAAKQLQNLRQTQGVKIRPRALITTLFARSLLADLFIHGIGGAVYDRVTDRIAEQFFGFAAPRHATATATLHLPIEHAGFDKQSPQHVASKLRDLRFNPQRFLTDSPNAQAAIKEKLHWIATPKTVENAAVRHQGILAANHAMQTLVEPLRKQLLAQKQALAAQARTRAILESREYAYCLFPEPWLQDQMTRLLAAPSTGP